MERFFLVIARRQKVIKVDQRLLLNAPNFCIKKLIGTVTIKFIIGAIYSDNPIIFTHKNKNSSLKNKLVNA